VVKWIIGGVVVFAAIGAAWYFLAGGGPAVRANTSHLATLKSQLVDATNRRDANAIASLTQQIAAAESQQAALGAGAPLTAESQIATCVSGFSLIAPTLSDILATDRSDWAPRMGKWHNILHAASDGMACMDAIASSATSEADLRALRTAYLKWGKWFRALQNRLYQSSHGGESGLDAYSGSLEPGGDDKANQLKVTIVDPMWHTLQSIDTRLSALAPADGVVTAELSAIAATASPPANGVFGA